MEPLDSLSSHHLSGLRAVLCDIDDTLTKAGRLPAASYAALERLRDSGLLVVPVTGRPAGWCDLIARQWPVDAVVGENGAFYFLHAEGRLHARFWKTEAERRADRSRLHTLATRILAAVPGCALASDQAYRASDLAIDFCEDVRPLDTVAVQRIVALFEAAGATAKVSSIHVNGWFGGFDKLAMTRALFAERFGIDLDRERDGVVFVGDSPNDAPMFAHFPLSVGVANVRDFAGRLPAEPAFVTRGRSASGFVELAEALLVGR